MLYANRTNEIGNDAEIVYSMQKSINAYTAESKFR